MVNRELQSPPGGCDRTWPVGRAAMRAAIGAAAFTAARSSPVRG